jgi:hypothetical protein
MEIHHMEIRHSPSTGQVSGKGELLLGWGDIPVVLEDRLHHVGCSGSPLESDTRILKGAGATLPLGMNAESIFGLKDWAGRQSMKLS